MREQRTNEREVRVDRADGDEAVGHLNGYAAVFYDGTPETQFELFTDFIERIMPGAFDRAIREDDVRALFNHNPDHVLGRLSAETLALSVDKTGLRYDISLADTVLAGDVRTHVDRREVTGSSFSFMITDQDFRTEDGVDIREIRGVELFDVGPVTFPAYDATTVTSRAGREDFDPVAAAVEHRAKWRQLAFGADWELRQQRRRQRRARAVQVQESARRL